MFLFGKNKNIEWSTRLILNVSHRWCQSLASISTRTPGRPGTLTQSLHTYRLIIYTKWVGDSRPPVGPLVRPGPGWNAGVYTGEGFRTDQSPSSLLARAAHWLASASSEGGSRGATAAGGSLCSLWIFTELRLIAIRSRSSLFSIWTAWRTPQVHS